MPSITEILSGTVDIIQGQVPGGGLRMPQNFASPSPQQMPATVTVNTRTGEVTKCKRRRRRRLLTESDFNDLMRISTLPSKDNVKIALAKAVGRSR